MSSYLMHPHLAAQNRAAFSQSSAARARDEPFHRRSSTSSYDYSYRSPESGTSQSLWTSASSAASEYGGPESPSWAASSSSGPSSSGWTPIPTAEARDPNTCQCGKTFRRPSDLAKHQKYHVKCFPCLFPGCERIFATQKDLNRHVRTHYKKEGEGWKCEVPGCKKAELGHRYSRKDNYERHLRTAHGLNTP